MKLRRRILAALVAGLILLPGTAALADGGGGDSITRAESGESAETLESLKEQLDSVAVEQNPTEVQERIESGRDDVVLMTPEGETVAALTYSELEAEEDSSGVAIYAISPIYVGCDMSGLTAMYMCVGQTGNYRTGFSGTGRYTISMKNVEVFQAGTRASGVQRTSNSTWIRGRPGQFVVMTSPISIRAVERV